MKCKIMVSIITLAIVGSDVLAGPIINRIRQNRQSQSTTSCSSITMTTTTCAPTTIQTVPQATTIPQATTQILTVTSGSCATGSCSTSVGGCSTTTTRRGIFFHR